MPDPITNPQLQFAKTEKKRGENGQFCSKTTA
jgi:hypothetical protein